MNNEKNNSEKSRCDKQSSCPPDDPHYAPESGEPLLSKPGPDGSDDQKANKP